MFGILYMLNTVIFIISIVTGKYDLVFISIGIHILISLWKNDNQQLFELKQKINKLDDTETILKIGKNKAKEFKDLTWFQKIIYLTAFKSGAEYIIKNIKK